MGARCGPDPVHRWSALCERQRALLERVAAGEEEPGAWSLADWRSAYALRDRGLLTVGRAGGHGHAEVTDAGRFYVRLGHHPEDPEFEGVGAQEVSAGHPASTRADGRREDVRRKRSPTPYSERPIARARRAKAQELVQRLVAEGRVLLHPCGGGPRGGVGSAVELLAAPPIRFLVVTFGARGGWQVGVVSGAVGAPVPEEGPGVVGSWFGDVGQSGGVCSGSRRSTADVAQLIHASASVLVCPRGHGLDSRAYGAQVIRESGGVAACRFLRFKVSEAVRLGVLDAGVFHSSFPADALLVCGFDLVETSAFGGFAAEGDLLCDLGELVFEGGRGRRTIRLPGAVGRC